MRVLSLGRFHVPSGWIFARVHTGNRHFRLVTTHLQGPIPGVPTAVTVQTAQANQLIYELRNSAEPVVIAGDSTQMRFWARPVPAPTISAPLLCFKPPAIWTPGVSPAMGPGQHGHCTWKTSIRRLSSYPRSSSNASSSSRD